VAQQTIFVVLIKSATSHKITVLEHASCGLCAIAELLVIFTMQ